GSPPVPVEREEHSLRGLGADRRARGDDRRRLGRVAARRALTAALAAVAVGALLSASPQTPPTRKNAGRGGEGVPAGSAVGPDATRRRNLEVQVGPEGTPVPKGYEVVHICKLPLPPDVASAVAKFPITFDPKGFTFDGRAYSGEEDAILLSDPSQPGEVFA